MADTPPIALERGADFICPHCEASSPRTRYAGLAGSESKCDSCDKTFMIPDESSFLSDGPETSPRSKHFARKPTPWMMLRRAAGSLIGTRLGQVDIIGLLGRGGMGAVYVGHHVDLDIDVAVKVLPEETAADEQLIQRFLREARLAIRLNHPNVVSIYNVGQQDGLYYIVMELVRGSDAAHMMHEGGRFSFRRALEIGIAATHALEAAHAEGLVHRDMKPHNILIATDGRVKVSDFGLARATAGQSGLTVSGQVMGTPHYMSPEQAETLPIDHRSDIYSLGVTLYHMLTGSPPFQGETPIAVALAHVRRDVPFPADVFNHFPEGIVPVLRRMCARNPQERYDSAVAVRVELEKLLANAGAEADEGDGLLPRLISETQAISSREREIQDSVRMTRTGSFYGIDRGWSARGSRIVMARKLGKAVFFLTMVAGLAGGGLFLYRELTAERPGRITPLRGGIDGNGEANLTPPTAWADAPLDKLFGDAEALFAGEVTAASLDETRLILKAAETLDPTGANAERLSTLLARLDELQVRYGVSRKLAETSGYIAAGDLTAARQSLDVASALVARAPGAVRAELSQEVDLVVAEARKVSDAAFSTALDESNAALESKNFSRARAALRGVIDNFLNDEQQRALSTTIEAVDSARREYFDSLESEVTKAVNASNIDHAHELLEAAAKLELSGEEERRLEKLQAQLPGRQRALEASRRLNEAWQAITAYELGRAQYKLNGVDDSIGDEIAMRKRQAEDALFEALAFESAIRQHDIVLAQVALDAMKAQPFDGSGFGAYETMLAGVRRELDRFNAALIESDRGEALKALDELKALQVSTVDLDERLREAEKERPLDDLAMIRTGRWYQVERRFRRFGWTPELGTPPPNASRDVINALAQVGQSTGYVRASDRAYFNSAALLAGGEEVLLADSNGTIELRSTDRIDGPALKSVTLEDAQPVLIRMAGDAFLCATNDGRLLLFDMETFTRIAEAPVIPPDEPMKRIVALAVTADHRLAVTASDDRRLRVFRLPELTLVGDPIELDTAPNAADISLAADALLTCGDNGGFQLYSLATRELLLTGNPVGQAARGAAFSPDGTLFAVSSGRNVYIYSIRDKRIYREHQRVSKADIRHLRFSPDGTALVLSDVARDFLVVDFEANSIVRQLNGHSREIIDFAFDADGRYLISCGSDRLALLWKMHGVPLY